MSQERSPSIFSFGMVSRREIPLTVFDARIPVGLMLIGPSGMELDLSSCRVMFVPSMGVFLA